MDEGKPIYYKGFREVLNGTKHFEDIIPDSNLQAWLKSELSFVLRSFFQNRVYIVTTGEQGLQLKKKSSRAAGIAIFRKENFELTNHYSKTAPDAIIEIDIKGEYESHTEAIGDYVTKLRHSKNHLDFYGKSADSCDNRKQKTSF